MNLVDLANPRLDHGVHSYVAEFYTEHLVVQARLTSPEIRLSDHLNSSVSTVDLRPLAVTQRNGSQIDLSGSHAPVTKDRVLFVAPVSEPERLRGASNAAWRQTTKHSCWVGMGGYSLSGTLHLESGRDPHISMRMLDKQFLAATDVTVVAPDGVSRHFPALLVNRLHIDLLALKNWHDVAG